jgi:hypothetical protein
MNKAVSLERISVSTRDQDNEEQKSLELNMITLLTGHNGSGKTFFLVTCYVISEVAQIAHRLRSVENVPQELIINAAQFITDSCYIKRLTGRIEGFFEGGAYLAIDMEDGTVTAVKGENWKDVEQVRGVRYMSTAMRTFESMGQYLFSRKLLADKSIEERYMELCKNWRLYDVQHVERMVEKMPITFDDNFKAALKNFDIKEDVVSFDVDLEKCDFFYQTSDGKKTYMRTLGSGHQSIFNMMIGSS